MSKQAKRIAAELNEGLAVEREKADAPKERKTFHRATEAHEKSPKDKNRQDRRNAKRDLRLDWT